MKLFVIIILIFFNFSNCQIKKEKIVYSINCGDMEYTDQLGITYKTVF